MPSTVTISFDPATVTDADLLFHQRSLASLRRRLFPKDKPPTPAPDTSTVVFREDWTQPDGIYPPDIPVTKRRWSDGSDGPNAHVYIAHQSDGTRELDAYVRDAHSGDATGDYDGARCFMTLDDPRWNDLPALDGKTVRWDITARLMDMPVVEYGAGKWLSIAEVKRSGNETPAGIQVNVRGDRGFNELYFVLEGKSYYFPTPKPLPSNTPFSFSLELALSRDAAKGAAYLIYDGQLIAASARTLGEGDNTAFALCAYGNNAPSLRVRFGEVVFTTA